MSFSGLFSSSLVFFRSYSDLFAGLFPVFLLVIFRSFCWSFSGLFVGLFPVFFWSFFVVSVFLLFSRSFPGLFPVFLLVLFHSSPRFILFFVRILNSAFLCARAGRLRSGRRGKEREKRER